MAKKAKITKSVAVALNWRTAEGYPDHGEQTDRWAWEFLRRNPTYRADWQRLVAIAEKFRDEKQDEAGKSGKGEAQESCPHERIDRAWFEGDARATAYDPPRYDGESESDWESRVLAGGKRCRTMPLDRSMGLFWGLEYIADPALPCNVAMLRWEAAPYGVAVPSPHQYNKESDWVETLKELAEILRPEPLLAKALTQARALLEKVPAAWDGRRKEMRASDHPEDRGRSVIEFDLRVSLAEQLKHATRRLEHVQATWRKNGGEVLSDGRRSKQTPGYAIYLRALDAIEEIGRNETVRWRQEIAGAMIKGYKSTEPYDERKRFLDRAGTWVKRAEQLRDGEYRRLVAMAVRSPIAQRTK